MKTLSATGDYVNAENRGDRDRRELRQLVAWSIPGFMHTWFCVTQLRQVALL